MKLKVNAIRLEASHAAFSWEQKLGTVLEVDVEATCLKRPRADRLDQTLDIVDVVNTVHRVSGKKTYCLIESLACDILDALWKKHRAKMNDLQVRVRKILPKSDRRIAGYEVEVRR